MHASPTLPPDAGEVVGRVARLARYPLRSAGGEDLRAVACTADGLEGDRAHVLVDGRGTALRGKDVPALAGLAAALVDGRLEVRDATGRALDDAALADATGVPGARAAAAAEHGAAPGGDAVAPLHVVSEGAEQGPGGDECDPHPRANVVLALAPDRAPGAERGWVGAELAVGTVRLRVARTPRRCLGVYADVLEPGEVAVGDEVRLVERPPGR
ncbi:MOSC N-terminal beta barrel domain-containing protein [Pseudokineococcus basanitobsidens]|uniref:MOSC N-terminal beta barrel domain-containing protein n=1 Tax=Pseudokineococcus basanitobsidens TaxID=1926649 RepID=A0ABU8RHQ9_9ACTN